MDVFKITGGSPLEGSIKASGAKNAITKMIVASLISDHPSTFFRVPNIREVSLTLELCQELGMRVERSIEDATLQVHTPTLTTTTVPQRFSGANRIPILLLGALLSRTKEAVIIPLVGGCNIGKRPVDFHIAALEKLGARVDLVEEDGARFYRAQALEGLHGAIIELPYPSVGATENTIMAAIRAKGKTVIRNAAIEPEIIDFILYLQKMGVHISIPKDREIWIEYSSEFNEVSHEVLADRIEVASFAMAAIATKGRVFIEHALHAPLLSFLGALRKIGGNFRVHSNGIEFFYTQPLRGGIILETDVHPGFLTDWQQPFVTLLTQSQGISIVHETVYENRFGYTETLNEMGANLELSTECVGYCPCRFQHGPHLHTLFVSGATPLCAKEITIPDLRAGFAYILAALVAEGESTIRNLHFIDRGYEAIERKLSTLGARISRQEESLSKNADLLQSIIENERTVNR